MIGWKVILPFCNCAGVLLGNADVRAETKYVSWGKVVNVLTLTGAVFAASRLNLANPALVGVFGILPAS